MLPDNQQEILDLLYSLANQRPYRPASYTCVKEFVPSFPKSENAKWTPEPPYPKIYTEGYKKTLLST